MDARSRAGRVKLIAFDIDGVMTDGGLCYTDDGHELKTFDVQDGLGLKLLQRTKHCSKNYDDKNRNRLDLLT